MRIQSAVNAPLVECEKPENLRKIKGFSSFQGKKQHPLEIERVTPLYTISSVLSSLKSLNVVFRHVLQYVEKLLKISLSNKKINENLYILSLDK